MGRRFQSIQDKFLKVQDKRSRAPVAESHSKLACQGYRILPSFVSDAARARRETRARPVGAGRSKARRDLPMSNG